MQSTNIKPTTWPLKTKLLSIFSLVTFIPVASIVLLQEVEKTLVSNLKNSLLLSTQLYSLQLSKHNEWFNTNQQESFELAIADELFVFPLNQPVSLDGFFDEWELLEHFRSNLKALDKRSDPDTLGFLMAEYEDNLYLSLQITDQTIIYPDLEPLNRSELVAISFIDNHQIPQLIFIQPKRPGKVPVKKTSADSMKVDWRFSAFWAETSDGFNVEIKFPNGLKPKHLQVRYYDVDAVQSQVYDKVIASSLLDLNPVIWPSPAVRDYVQELNIPAGQRIWVLDDKGRVMARKGDLIAQDSLQKINPIIRWLFAPNDKFQDFRQSKLRLSTPAIESALAGVAQANIEQQASEIFSVVVAASPIMRDDEIVGVVLVEENVAKVQLTQRQTLAHLLYVNLLIIGGVLAVVIWYITRIINRIKRLDVDVNHLVDDKGRVQQKSSTLSYIKTDSVKNSRDEIDNLTQSFAEIGERLYEYHDYLEKLASRLSHELRTPIAIVRSSLDNLMLDVSSNKQRETIERALQGTERLGEIISRMRQASGVKEAMQSAETETVDLKSMLDNLVAGYRQTFVSFKFKLEANVNRLEKSMAPELIAEMIDKLISNAVDFANPNSTIKIVLNQTPKAIVLSVENNGPLIEKKFQKKIFQSLVSIRENQSSQSANLGLGLYVVRLIAEFHGARAQVKNLDDGSGVVFSIVWDEPVASK